MYYSISEITETPPNPRIAPILLILLGLFLDSIGAGRGGSTPPPGTIELKPKPNKMRTIDTILGLGGVSVIFDY